MKVNYRVFSHIILLVVLVFWGGLAFAANKSAHGQSASSKNSIPLVAVQNANAAYEQAKKRYDSLINAPKLRKDKDAWEEVIAQFRKVYLSFPENGEIAPKALWMLGRCYDEMYGWTGRKPLLDEAITRYATLVEKFPQHSLADDALMAMARLYLLKEEKEAAIAAWRRVVSDYANGDMIGHARERLKAYSADRQSEAMNAAQSSAVSPKDDGAIKEVEDVRYWSVSDYTRVVIATSGPVSFKEGWLPGDDGKGLPRRFYLDISPAHKSKRLKDLTVKAGFLKGVRIGQFDPKTVRVVCDLGSSNDVKAFYLEDPFRVIIDAFGETYKTQRPCVVSSVKPQGMQTRVTDQAAVLPEEQKRPTLLHKPSGQAKEIPSMEQQPGPTKEELAIQNKKLAMLKGKPSLAKQLGLCVRRIVVDPGHGGKDPGAIGPTGLKEKDVTLKLAKKVAARLREELGAEVILTRDRDVFVPLEQRTAIANAQKADLFVSIHTNAAPSSRLRGIETYYLNFAVDEHAMRVAALENASSSKRMGDLSGILNQILKNTKVDESSRLARAVQDALIQSIRGNGGKDLGVKQAPFFVLIGAKMPSILVETSFISNAEEERMLKDNAYLDQLSSGIVSGIRHYMKDMDMNAGGG